MGKGRRDYDRRRLIIVLGVWFCLFDWTANGAAEPIFGVTTSNGHDTIYLGGDSTDILFTCAAADVPLTAISWGVILRFTQSNVLGTLTEGVNVWPSTPSTAAFDVLSFSAQSQGTNPDSFFFVGSSMSDRRWKGDGTVWYIRARPVDTGAIIFDSTVFRIGLVIGYPRGQDEQGSSVGEYTPDTIFVVCPVKMGDVNQDDQLNSADLIYFINYLFKGGPDPLPERAAGDVNCSGGLTGADVIWLVNHIFKGGPTPCVCFIGHI